MRAMAVTLTLRCHVECVHRPAPQAGFLDTVAIVGTSLARGTLGDHALSILGVPEIRWSVGALCRQKSKPSACAKFHDPMPASPVPVIIMLRPQQSKQSALAERARCHHGLNLPACGPARAIVMHPGGSTAAWRSTGRRHAAPSSCNSHMDRGAHGRDVHGARFARAGREDPHQSGRSTRPCAGRVADLTRSIASAIDRAGRVQAATSRPGAGFTELARSGLAQPG